MTRDDPDTIALEVMNHILGGGGFTRPHHAPRAERRGPRVRRRVVPPDARVLPGVAGAFFQSKNRTVALAAKIVVEELERIRTEPVSEVELDVAKNAFVERFPQQFASRQAVLNLFVEDELTGRDPAFWRTYRDRVRAIDADEVRRVAHAHLTPEEMAILIVGDWEEIYGGDLEGRASMNEFFGGDVEHLPMLDPLTLEPIE